MFREPSEGCRWGGAEQPQVFQKSIFGFAGDLRFRSRVAWVTRAPDKSTCMRPVAGVTGVLLYVSGTLQVVFVVEKIRLGLLFVRQKLALGGNCEEGPLNT